MFLHPTILAQTAQQHTNELIEEASRHRLASALRRGRRQLWPDSLPAEGRPAAGAARPVPVAEKDRKDRVPRSENAVAAAGTLTGCEPAELTRGRAR